MMTPFVFQIRKFDHNGRKRRTYDVNFFALHYGQREKERERTYKDIVLYPDDVAAPKVGRRERRNVELLVPPVVRLSGLDFPAVQ